ncbi:MAG TPA: hypothetical protein VLA82_11900, partial [Actinomycetota bacterium]|nr:hypothetical protein [Actinomycetota bacterium]
TSVWIDRSVGRLSARAAAVRARRTGLVGRHREPADHAVVHIIGVRLVLTRTVTSGCVESRAA